MSSNPSRPPSPRASSPNSRSAAAKLGAFLGMSALGGVLVAGLMAPGAAALSTVTDATGSMLEEIPAGMELPEPSQQSVMRYADGSHMATFFAENRIVVPLEQISQPMRDAVVAIEDKRFYEHRGVDPQGIARAFVNNITGGPLEGASTLTQQYVRNSLIEQGRQTGDAEQIDAATETSVGRKLREISLAVALEKQEDKDAILAGYLNIAQFGPSEYGVEAAARHYFSIPASQLSIVQAALLAGITQSPNRWDPVGHPEDAKTRRDTVLMEMHDQGFITDAEYQEALATTIEEMLVVQNTPNGCEAAGSAAYFCEYVVKDLLNNDAWGESRDERTAMLYRGGLVIDTTLQPALQTAAQQSLERTIPISDPSNIDTSLVSVEPHTGKIVAMAQNTEFGRTTDGNPDVTLINVNVGRGHGGGLGFQAGSAFKVFTLVEWLNAGHGLYDRVNQAERRYPARSWEISCAPEYADTYEPSNLYTMASGTTTVAQATKLSTNIPFIDMANKLDLCAIMEDASKMGVERGDGGDLVPRPSAVLGTNEVTPLSMANSFATIAARGQACKPLAVTRIATGAGEEIASLPSECEQVLPEGVMDTTTLALTQVMQAGGTGAKSTIGRPAAAKTGTANDAANGWFVGYTPQYATAVWTGHRAGNKPMMNVRVNGRYHSTVYGSTLSGPIWQRYMIDAHQGVLVESFTAPTRMAPKANSRGNRSTRDPGTSSTSTSGSR